MAHTDVSPTAENEADFAESSSSTVANGGTPPVMPLSRVEAAVTTPKGGSGPVLNPRGTD